MDTLTEVKPKLSARWSGPIVWVPLPDILAGDSCDGIVWDNPHSWQGPQFKRDEYGTERWSAFLDDLRTNGLEHPVMWDCGNRVLGNGHHRVVAAIDLGWTHIPVTPWRFEDDLQSCDAWYRSGG